MGNYLHTIFAIISYKVFLCLISSQSNPYLANASPSGSNPTVFLLPSTVSSILSLSYPILIISFYGKGQLVNHEFRNSGRLILYETRNNEKIFRQFA